ncbi:MAG: phospholipase D family protein [Candidatus Bathyarchaeia archaeon]
MTDVRRFLRGSQIAEELRNGITTAEKIKIAVAFLKEGGYSEIEKNLQTALDDGKSVDFLVGACPEYHITDPKVLFDLKKLDNNYVNFNLGLFRKADFHPKLFVFQNGDSVRVIMGSSNLTSGGTGNNIEANILVEGNTKQQIIRDIVSFFDNEVLPKSEPLIDDYIKYYQKICGAHAKGVTKTREFRMPKVRYRLYLKDVQPLNESRASFDKRHGISNYDARRGAIYSRKNGQIEAIIVFWYKGNVDKYFPKQPNPYLGSVGNLDRHNLRVGMDVYLLETEYDRTSGSYKKVDNPKARAYGKLRAVKPI